MVGRSEMPQHLQSGHVNSGAKITAWMYLIHQESRLRHTMRRLDILLLASGVFMFLNANGIVGTQDANAQFPPIFPPPPGSAGEDGAGTGDNLSATPNDRNPPKIKVVTKELREGKNVLIVEISDASHLKSRQVKYANEGKIKFSDLARDHDNVYHALITVNQPSSIIVIDVTDAAGNRATVTEEIPVGPPLTLGDLLDQLVKKIDQLVDWWDSLATSFGVG